MNPFKYWSITFGLFVVAVITTLIVTFIKILAALSHGFFIDSGAVFFNSLGKRIMVRSMRIFDYAEGKKQPGAEERKSIVNPAEKLSATEQLINAMVYASNNTDKKFKVSLEDAIGRDIFTAYITDHCANCAARNAASVARKKGIRFEDDETYASVWEVKE